MSRLHTLSTPMIALAALLWTASPALAQDEPAQPETPESTDAQTEPESEIELLFDEDGNLLPRHYTRATQDAVERGLNYLASTQAADGSWRNTQDGGVYPVTMTSLAGMAFLAGGNTTSRGPYADNVNRAVRYVLSQANEQNGLIAAGNENGRTMYPHGFAMLFLANAYGMENDPAMRQVMERVINRGIELISAAQSDRGGWYYTPNSGDEGSVTVTQLQALRAAHNAGFVVPETTIDRAVQYLEMCRTPEGGIRYSYQSSNSSRLPISAAALPCLYSTGDYESDMAEACLAYVFREFCLGGNNSRWNKSGGHDFYGHYYAAQAFYQAGDDYWDVYFPAARDQLLNMQAAGANGNGAWDGDSVGTVYGTAMALTILQLPYAYLPIYQR